MRPEPGDGLDGDGVDLTDHRLIESLDGEMRRLVDEILTEKQRAVVLARVERGYGWKRIGQLLDCDPATARGHWRAASTKLRRELNKRRTETTP